MASKCENFGGGEYFCRSLRVAFCCLGSIIKIGIGVKASDQLKINSRIVIIIVVVVIVVAVGIIYLYFSPQNNSAISLKVNMAAEDETNKDMNVNLLIGNRANIIEALMHDPSKAFDDARATVLNRQNYSDMKGEKTNADKVRMCLDIVDGKGEVSATKFLKILYKHRKSYPRLGPWITDDPKGEVSSVHG